MKKILHVISDSKWEESNCKILGNAVIGKLVDKYPGSIVEELNLLETNVPHFNPGHLSTLSTYPELLPIADPSAIYYSDTAINLLMETDILIIDAPIINWGLPSTLKAWIDHIVRVGRTIHYDKNGVSGMVTGKKVYIAISSDEVCSVGPWTSFDFVTPYLTTVLGFLGMADLRIFRVEGTNIHGIKEVDMAKAIENIEL